MGFSIITIVINIIACAQQCTSVLDCFLEEKRCALHVCPLQHWNMHINWT